MTDLKTALAWRYATKKFDPSKKVSEADLASILEAGNLAPTAYGLQPFRIIKIENRDLRSKMREVSYGQAQVTEAGTLLVIARRTDIDEAYITEYIERTAEIRGMNTADLEGFKATMIGDMTSRSQENINAWSGRQSYIALGTMIAQASLLGVDTGPMEGFVNAQVDEILDLKEHNLESVAYLVLGYRDESDTFASLKKVRLPLEDFVITK
jgi:nitroreductase / dihydropteridine reductase